MLPEETNRPSRARSESSELSDSVGIEMLEYSVRDLMKESGVKMGTSGARGKAVAQTDQLIYVYDRGFYQLLEQVGKLGPGQVAVAGDLRESTPRLISAALLPAVDSGLTLLNCGYIPTPALANYAFELGVPSIMVTGSHIPGDENGRKYYFPDREMFKSDEPGLLGQKVKITPGIFDPKGQDLAGQNLPAVSQEARALYVSRYRDFFGPDVLRGWRIGVWQHTAVGRDLMVEVAEALGAEAVPLERKDVGRDGFIQIDTEAFSAQDYALVKKLVRAHRLDLLISTDGDSDRPVIGDNTGMLHRADEYGVLVAKLLGAKHVSCPLSCSSAVEQSGYFETVVRTSIGSPYVLAEMKEVGYEANGGFMTGRAFVGEAGELSALPTRDAFIVNFGIAVLAAREGKSVAQLFNQLPPVITDSGRIQGFPRELANNRIMPPLVDWARTGNFTALEKSLVGLLPGEVVWTNWSGDQPASTELVDGLRIRCKAVNGEELYVHLRASGNSDDFRIYTEARKVNGKDPAAGVKQVTENALKIMRLWQEQVPDWAT
jgi:phosphomannomutase